MTIKTIRDQPIKTYIVLLLAFMSSALASELVVFKFMTMWFDENYVASLHLSPDADSLGIPIFSAFFMGIFIIIFLTCIYSLLLGIVAYQQKLHSVVRLSAISLRMKPGRITKIFVLLFALFCVGILYFPPFYEYVNPFYIVTDAVSCLLGISSGLLLCLIVDIIARQKKSK